MTMLKRLFTSNARVKLLTLFLTNPDDEFFIRELTRKLDEQINSVRRELDNLKKIGVLKSKSRNRKKYYTVDKGFFLLSELKAIITKAGSQKEGIAKKIAKLGNIELLILSGVFTGKSSQADILIVGDLDSNALADLLDQEMDTQDPIRFTIMRKDDFLYRMKCHDKFVTAIVENEDNIIAVNKMKALKL
jgi:hypothetical protein